MSFLKYRGSFPKRVWTFHIPSIVSDTDTPDTHPARDKFKRDLEKFLREADRYLGAGEISQLARKVANARKGNIPDGPLNKLLLTEWDAAVATNPAVTRTEFAKGFYKRYRQQSVRAVEKRLKRALQTRERKAAREATFGFAKQRPSLLNEPDR